MNRFDDALHYVWKFTEEGTGDLFVTGRAGTGKSTLLVELLRKISKRTIVLAPTGVAALNVGGQTIHRFFGFGTDITPRKVRERRYVRNPELYRNLEIIIIDEVSMMRADLLDCVEVFLRKHGPEPGQPFGGIRLIYFGDLLQLSPVVTRTDRAAIEAAYDSPFFFSAAAFRERMLEILELPDIYRQSDRDFIALLERVRSGSIDHEDAKMLNSRLSTKTEAGRSGVVLTGTNAKADYINSERLSQIASQSISSSAEVTGEFGREYYPCAAELTFKVGAQVMLVNNDADGRWVNGSVGTIIEVPDRRKRKEAVRIGLSDGGGPVLVKRHSWDVCKFEFQEGEIHSSPTGRFNQLPFRLAWAITIHKSQGKTFEHIEIDLERSFSPGQMYVALSRCRTFEGIALRRAVKAGSLPIDERVTEFLSERKRSGWCVSPGKFQ